MSGATVLPVATQGRPELARSVAVLARPAAAMPAQVNVAGASPASGAARQDAADTGPITVGPTPEEPPPQASPPEEPHSGGSIAAAPQAGGAVAEGGITARPNAARPKAAGTTSTKPAIAPHGDAHGTRLQGGARQEGSAMRDTAMPAAPSLPAPTPPADSLASAATPPALPELAASPIRDDAQPAAIPATTQPAARPAAPPELAGAHGAGAPEPGSSSAGAGPSAQGDGADVAAPSPVQTNITSDTPAVLPASVQGAAQIAPSGVHMAPAPGTASQPASAAALPDAVPAGRIGAQITPTLISLSTSPAAEGTRTVSLQITPVSLGRITVEMQTAEGQPRAIQISAEHAATLSLLQQDHGEITRALTGAGLDPGGYTLQFSLATPPAHHGAVAVQEVRHDAGRPGFTPDGARGGQAGLGGDAPDPGRQENGRPPTYGTAADDGQRRPRPPLPRGDAQASPQSAPGVSSPGMRRVATAPGGAISTGLNLIT